MDSYFERFKAAPFIKEIGRGKNGARSLSESDAAILYSAMLAGRVSDLEMGAILLALRIKGESRSELAGFWSVAQENCLQFDLPIGPFAPIVIPSYNGARKNPNLTALLALCLAQQGVPVLIHGLMDDSGRVTTAQILQVYGLNFAKSREEVNQQLQHNKISFAPVELLSPKLAKLLHMRSILGVRNSTHTLVKILQPFSGRALRLCAYTHPEYQRLLQDFFTSSPNPEYGDIFMMRASEGEVVVNVKRMQALDHFHDGHCTQLVPKALSVEIPDDLPSSIDAKTTAFWIKQVLSGKINLPKAIDLQIKYCLRTASELNARYKWP